MILSIVVPCFNEQEVLRETAGRIDALIDDLVTSGDLDDRSHVIFVDDGSTDCSWTVVQELAAAHERIRGLKLSRNRGHQNALLAGLMEADGDAVISVDADLQDDLGVISEMVNAYKGGSDIVYGVRKKRDTDTFFKRFTAEGYYRILEMFGVEIIYNHADYRLMSMRAIAALAEFTEVNLFLRGVVPQIGFQSTIVYYNRSERYAGESKYPLSKMLSLAWQGITSFSSVPLHMITVMGLLVSLGSFMVTLWALGVRIFGEHAVPGWASTVVPIFLLGGVQLLSIGIIGEYLGKIYMETKRRPRFILDTKVGFPSRR